MRDIFKAIIVKIITLESQVVLWKYGPRIIAVTGSVGKTSTKDAIFAVIGNAFYAYQSKKSYNSEIGIPLTILMSDNPWYSVRGWLRVMLRGMALIFLKNHYPRWLVIEVGVDKPGDMDHITKWLSVDVAVFTHLGTTPVHVEAFESPEALRREKLKLISALQKEGVIVYNRDDQNQHALDDSAQKRRSYGITQEVDIQASDISITYVKKTERTIPEGMHATISYGEKILSYNPVGVLGTAHMYPALAALAVATVLNIDFYRASQSLMKYPFAPGRMRIIDGHDGCTIIDDSYNSSPIALKNALDVLSDIETNGRKICVLGDMSELGKHTEAEHRKAGKLVAGLCDQLVTVGQKAKIIADEARIRGMNDEAITLFEDARKAGTYVHGLAKRGDIVLVKGSQNNIHLERAVEILMRYPELAQKTLVRQGDGWN